MKQFLDLVFNNGHCTGMSIFHRDGKKICSRSLDISEEEIMAIKQLFKQRKSVPIKGCVLKIQGVPHFVVASKRGSFYLSTNPQTSLSLPSVYESFKNILYDCYMLFDKTDKTFTDTTIDPQAYKQLLDSEKPAATGPTPTTVPVLATDTIDQTLSTASASSIEEAKIKVETQPGILRESCCLIEKTETMIIIGVNNNIPIANREKVKEITSTFSSIGQFADDLRGSELLHL
ncbi:hypothetical protein DFA_03474 [Cavenderia fasciculata]|uniref:Profilin n=1 Tax=Cavenderia fasciculata TaxID=261658 RepID=F4PHP2_CACFS|nr:uncharacterized protein DFA_03474 [Cavenderia fasciculata]EGG25226.1 hypothetical protein DFA_03474 [Cavenderia fasciculata]|eukprot:XP_004363077.1 hypothetical protein DFA_03474 [Cavenderia fasciculata]